MTAAQVIGRLDELKFNSYPREQKELWLRQLEGLAAAWLGCQTGEELLIPPPYDAAYLHWLAAQIDLWDREYTAYNNDISLFNTEFEAFRAAHLRAAPYEAKVFRR